jgi:RNA polymerase sigma factor (sigma-70 family)
MGPIGPVDKYPSSSIVSHFILYSMQHCGSQVARFRTTHWSVITDASQGETTSGTGAREELCRTYWFPLYAFIRRKGHDAESAKDLTQAFFLHLLSNCRLGKVGKEKGKFRTFLLCALNNFLVNEWDRSRRLTRGAGYSFFSLDAEDPEERYKHETADPSSPERAYDKEWAKALMAQVLNRLREEVEGAVKGKRFDILKGFLVGDSSFNSYADAAEHIGVSEQAVKGAVLRLRRKFGELLREEIGRTVNTPEQVDEEIRYLLRMLAE